MMIRRILILCFVLLIAQISIPVAFSLPPPPLPRHTFTVTGGDVKALIEAIETSNRDFEGYNVRIDVSGDFHFDASSSLPPVEGLLYILGPARFIGGGAGVSVPQGDQGGPSQLFEVLPEANLHLNLIEISGFSLNHDNEALINNHGNLLLEKVQIENVYSESYCRESCTPQMPIFYNHSDAKMDLSQVSIVNSGTTYVDGVNKAILLENNGLAVLDNTQIYFDENRTGWNRNFIILNRGSVYARFSTLYFNRSRNQEAPELIFTDSESDASSLFENSVIFGFESRVCRYAFSLGNTIIDLPESECGWDAPGDKVGADPRLIWRTVDANWEPGPQFVTHALVPLSDSPVIDTVGFNQCPYPDLLNVYRITEARPKEGPDTRTCDSGAVAYRQPELSSGGINGYYYNPDDDGHYISIQQTDYLTLVTWNTFDLDGNWAWIVGYAKEVKDGKIIADSYVNRKGEITSDTVNPKSGAQHWGTIEIELSGCWDGVVRYQSDYPGFASGEFPIRRLAFVKQIGCMD